MNAIWVIYKQGEGLNKMEVQTFQVTDMVPYQMYICIEHPRSYELCLNKLLGGKVSSLPLNSVVAHSFRLALGRGSFSHDFF